MKLRELLNLLQSFVDHNPDENPEIVVKSSEPSIGPHKVINLVGGFDWNNGKVFLILDQAMVRAIRIEADDILTYCNKLLEGFKDLGWTHAHKKDDVFREGFEYGAKWGSTRLLEHNVLKKPER